MSTKRWIDESSDASELERAVLASGLDAEPPVGAEHAIWENLAGVVGLPVTGGGGAPPAAGAGSAGTALTGVSTAVTLGKGFALGVAVSLAAVGIGRIESARAPHPKSVASALPASERSRETAGLSSPNPTPELPRTTLSPPAAEVAATPRAAPAPVRPLVSVPSSTPLRAPSEPARAAGTSSVATFPLVDASAQSQRSQLEEEASMLRRARAELRANQLAQAFATLEASREKFSFPELTQEREALLIELLYRSGQRENAVDKARAFLRRYPNSPHAAQVASIARAEAR